MAYRSGYVTGYQDNSAGYVFTPTATGYSVPINTETQGGECAIQGLWSQYGNAIPVQATILYTSGTSVKVQGPDGDTIEAADAGSGRGDKMVFRTPGVDFPITDAEALVIIADETYDDAVGQL